MSDPSKKLKPGERGKVPLLRDLFGFSSDDGRHELDGEEALLELAEALRGAGEVVRRLIRAPYSIEELPHRCRTLVIREEGGALRVAREPAEDAIVIEGSREALDALAATIEAFAETGDVAQVRVSDELTIGCIL